MTFIVFVIQSIDHSLHGKRIAIVDVVRLWGFDLMMLMVVAIMLMIVAMMLMAVAMMLMIVAMMLMAVAMMLVEEGFATMNQHFAFCWRLAGADGFKEANMVICICIMRNDCSVARRFSSASNSSLVCFSCLSTNALVDLSSISAECFKITDISFPFFPPRTVDAPVEPEVCIYL